MSSDGVEEVKGGSGGCLLTCGLLWQVMYEDSRMVSLTAPYISGFLAFREVPFLVDLVQRLQEKEPDLIPQAGASLRW